MRSEVERDLQIELRLMTEDRDAVRARCVRAEEALRQLRDSIAAAIGVYDATHSDIDGPSADFTINVIRAAAVPEKDKP